jgi:hypothetical protein
MQKKPIIQLTQTKVSLVKLRGPASAPKRVAAPAPTAVFPPVYLPVPPVLTYVEAGYVEPNYTGTR